MIKIYDINDNVLMQAEVTSAAKREQEMSKSDYISLSFSAAEKIILPAGAYINYTYKIDKVREVTRKFLLLESYEPTQSDECSWKYTPQFQHPKMILSKTPFFIYTRNSQNVEVKQNVWSFVGTTSVLSDKIANFLNKDLMFGECGWKVIFLNVTANTVNVSFSDNDFISALTAITNAIGDNCEWHIDYDDEIIYIGKVLVGAIPVVLEVGKNVGVPNITNIKEGYYNAFSIFGGTRNITQVNSKGENVSSGDIRLQLNEGNGTMTIDGKECSYSIDKYSTLDLRADKTKEPLFTKVLDFSQIFPSLNTYVYNVRGRVKYVLDEKNNKIPISNADGSIKGYKTFTVWYMRLAYPTTEKVEGKTIINTTVDDGVTHYWYDFEVTDNLLIKGKNIGCSFEANFNTGALSTPLAGHGTNGEYVGFELTYHKEASSSHTSDDVSKDNFSVLAGDYEIIYQEDNEVIIPTNKEEMLIPRGERLPSLKCNITVLYNIAMADTIYYEDAQNRLLEKAKEEIVRLLSDLNNYEVKSYSDVFLEDNPQLQIGQSVTYKDGHGYELATRVLKLSTNIDYDFIQSITIGNQVIKGTITQLKEDVQTIIASGGSSGNGGGYSVSQLRKLIAKYGSDNFISKQFDDIANGTITFQKIQKFLQGLLVGNSNNENGGSWTPDAEGRSHLITDYLEVRMKAIFEELVINKTSTIGGKEIISPAGGVVAHKVEEVTVTYNNVSQKAYRCYFLAEQEGDAVDNDFAVGDQVRSESFNVRKGTYHKAGNHFYWRLVIGRDEDPVELEGKKYHYIDLSDTDCATASDVPAKGDVLNQCGNRTDVERQNCLIFSAVDTYSPSISLYHGINSYSFANREYVEYGVNKQNNKAFFHVYGDMYFGDRPTSANNYEGSSYVKYDSDKKKVTIKGDLDIKSTYDGKTLDKYITEKSLDKNAVETIIKKSETITDLQNQIDGAIETWFYDGVPTLSNAPAIGWTTDKDKKTHLGDLYYDNKTGKAYRFAKDGSTYKWIIITDTELTKAIEDSSQALKDAKSKRRIFGSQPVPPYDVNDMWVNATYPSDGSTYKNEILKCSTAKAEGEEFNIADWKLASKYTDDTKAEEAKKAAEKAQAEIKNTQTNLIALGTTVSNNKKAFDVFTSDGYLDSSEIAAIAQDSKRLEDDYNAAVESYNNVVGSKFLLDKDGKETTYKTDLVSAKATLDSAKNELITYLSDIVSRYNASDSNGKATIKAAAAQKYTNFTNVYKAFYDKLGVANNYITSNLFDGLNTKLITNMAGLEYIKAALVDGDTVVKGGLILSTLIALRNDKGNVTAGINGADTKENGIALWLGGKAIDKQASTTTEEEKKIAAKSLLRFDGTGYFANGNLWWDADGILHADPTSFIINKNNVGVQLALFAPVWKSGTTDTTKLANVLSIDPQKPFTHLDVSGNVTTEGSLKIGGIYLSYDSANNALRLSKDAAGKEAANFYALGGITAYGAGASTTGGGGLIASVISYADALKLTSESLSEIASAYSIKALDSRISSLEGGSATAISVSGSGNAVTSVTKNGTTISVVKGSTFLTSHQSLDGYVNAISVSGSGNAITSVSKSGKGITFTKGATFLTSHQSLANYYTKSSVDSLLSGKSATSHTHSVKINGVTKTIAATGGTAVDLGTYLTSHQSLADYAKKTEIPTKVSQLTNDTGYITSSGSCAYATSAGNADKVDGVHVTWAGELTSTNHLVAWEANGSALRDINPANVTVGNSDKLDGIHANGLLTALSNSDKGISITVGGTTKSVANISVNYASSAGDSDTVDGLHVHSGRNYEANKIVRTDKYGYIECGYIDCSLGNEGNNTSPARVWGTNGSDNYLRSYITSALNVASATKLQTARTIWGQAFDGTGNVNGTIYINNSNSSNGAIRLNSDISSNARISAIDDQVIFNTGNAIRFGETAWDWNQWAGLKYTHSNKTIYLGIAEGSAFNANSPQSDGTLRLAGIKTITPDSGARIGGSGGDLYLGNVDGSAWVRVQKIRNQSRSGDVLNWYINEDGEATFNKLEASAIMYTTPNSNKYSSLPNWDGSIGANVTNMFNGIPYDNISIEYSQDNGVSWSTYTLDPSYRFNLVNDNTPKIDFILGNNYIVGNTAVDKRNQIKKNQLRVTIKIPNEIYQELSWISVDVSNSVNINCEVYFGDNNGNYSKSTNKVIKGNNHICDICVGPLGINVGNDSHRYVRLVFSHLISHIPLRNGIIRRIRALALTKYKKPGDRYNISTTGHIYNYDYNMNTYFPNSILAKGGVTAYQSSDVRLKTNITKLNCLNVIKSIGGTYEFDYLRDHKHSIGFIAQNVNNPLLKDIVAKDKDGYLKINYWSPKLISLAFGALTEIDNEVDKLKARVRELEIEVEQLKK